MFNIVLFGVSLWNLLRKTVPLNQEIFKFANKHDVHDIFSKSESIPLTYTLRHKVSFYHTQYEYKLTKLMSYKCQFINLGWEIIPMYYIRIF